LDVNKTGKSFKLERGNAQGDTISPFLFNICYQLLILKVETSLQINSIFDNVPGQDPGAVAEQVQEEGPQRAQQEPPVRLLPRKVFAFADDCNILTLLDQGCISEIKKVLEAFHLISGLECNLSKTSIMQICPAQYKLENTGFQDCDSVTVLGLELYGTLQETVDINYEKIRLKVANQINFWKNLT
jgi:hypothetical protein